jgi:hypothetical protein
MGYLCNVVIDGDVWMVVAKDASSFWINLATENDLVSRVGEAKITTTASREQ